MDFSFFSFLFDICKVFSQCHTQSQYNCSSGQGEILFIMIFAFTVFILVLPYIIEVFRFYNSVLQTVIVAAAIVMITLLTKQNKLFTIILFLLRIIYIGWNQSLFSMLNDNGSVNLQLGVDEGLFHFALMESDYYFI